MNVRRLTAGVLALADSLLGIFLGYVSPPSSVSGALITTLFWSSIVLLVVSLLCLYGVHYAFLAAAVLSAALAIEAPLTQPSMALEAGLFAFSIISMVANILAFRAVSQLSEQVNPMNLPVFG
jgi:membrane protein implicated in regulation of membrane protease activity